MIREEKLMKEVKWLEKEVEGMHHPTKTAFLKADTWVFEIGKAGGKE